MIVDIPGELVSLKYFVVYLGQIFMYLKVNDYPVYIGFSTAK